MWGLGFRYGEMGVSNVPEYGEMGFSNIPEYGEMGVSNIIGTIAGPWCGAP